MKNKKKAGFTLAEVLIALTVIGIISALTIPTLVQKTNKQEYVSALQKAYSTLSQAANMITAAEGMPGGNEGWAASSERVYELFKKHLNNAKECGTGQSCFPQNIHYLKGNGTHNFDGSGYRKLILADGVQMMFENDYWTQTSCPWKEADEEYGICGWVYLDVNGEKSPNKYGRDVFSFEIRENGQLTPRGCHYNGCRTDISESRGEGCACKVLREGKMDY